MTSVFWPGNLIIVRSVPVFYGLMLARFTFVQCYLCPYFARVSPN